MHLTEHLYSALSNCTNFQLKHIHVQLEQFVKLLNIYIRALYLQCVCPAKPNNLIVRQCRKYLLCCFFKSCFLRININYENVTNAKYLSSPAPGFVTCENKFKLLGSLTVNRFYFQLERSTYGLLPSLCFMCFTPGYKQLEFPNDLF